MNHYAYLRLSQTEWETAVAAIKSTINAVADYGPDCIQPPCAHRYAVKRLEALLAVLMTAGRQAGFVPHGRVSL